MKHIYVIQYYEYPIAVANTTEDIERILDEYTRGTIIEIIPCTDNGFDNLYGTYYYLVDIDYWPVSDAMDQAVFKVYKVEINC